MQRGILKEFGSFNDLIARKGEFAQITKRVLEDMNPNDENDTIQDCKYPSCNHHRLRLKFLLQLIPEIYQNIMNCMLKMWKGD